MAFQNRIIKLQHSFWYCSLSYHTMLGILLGVTPSILVDWYRMNLNTKLHGVTTQCTTILKTN